MLRRQVVESSEDVKWLTKIVKWLKVFLFKMKVYFKNNLGVTSTFELEKNNTID